MGREVNWVRVGFGNETLDRTTPNSDGGIDECPAALIDSEISFANLEMMGVGFEADGVAGGKIIEKPEAVVGPKAAEFDHRGRAISRASIGKSLHERREDRFFLRLMYSTKATNDIARNGSVVTALYDENAVMHYLNSTACMVDDFSGIRDTRKVVGVGA